MAREIARDTSSAAADVVGRSLRRGDRKGSVTMLGFVEWQKTDHRIATMTRVPDVRSAVVAALRALFSEEGLPTV